MLKYTNTLNTKWKKMKDCYQNDLFQSELDANYRWQLRSLIGKAVVIESLDYEIQTKTLESETGEYEVKEILLRDAQVTRVNPYDNESLPLILDHIWVMVGNDLELDKEYSKVKIKGTVGEYLKSSGVKDIGIDAEYCHFNDGKNIVVPKNYQGTKGFDEVEEKREENPVVCPKEFEHMVLNAKECEFLGLWKMYEFDLYYKEHRPSFAIVKNFGGPYKFQNMYNKIYSLKYIDIIHNYLSDDKNEGKVFDINRLTGEERFKCLADVETNIVSHYENEYGTRYYTKKSLLDNSWMSGDEDVESAERVFTYGELVTALCKSVNMNVIKGETNYHILLFLSKAGLIEIGQDYVGTYVKELEEYEKLMKERNTQIEKLRKEYGNLEIQVKEIPKPKNKDCTYYYGILSEEAMNLIRWFGKEVPEHKPLTSVPNA